MEHNRIAPLHPIVAQMQASDEQLPAVLARGQDIVVTAGAGTGKTRTLVARYLSLLATHEALDSAGGPSLRSILAVTFTRKAAREMRNRVRDEIRHYLERTDLTEQERERWQHRYSALDAARIGTIHSLCSEILHAHPAEADIDPRFQVLDEGLATILLGRAVDEALAWASDDVNTIRLFDLLGEGGLRTTLESLLKQRLEATECFDSLPQPLWPLWEERLLPAIRALVDDPHVRGCFEELQILRNDGTLDRAEQTGDGLALPLRQLLAIWDEIVAAHQREDWAAVSARLAPLRAVMKTSGRAANWKPADPKAAIGELQMAYDTHTLAWQGKAIDLGHDRELADAMPALHALFVQADAAYRRFKQERGALDYDDLEQGALNLLRNPAVRSRWQREFQAILIDEFQDTNARQRDLIALLGGQGGKLFIVGDAKQSIYRFRGADVGVFRQERERIEKEGGRHLPLQTSYRAHRALVQGLNDLLRPILGEASDPQRPWVEPFAPLGYHRDDPGTGFVAPHIELHLTVGSKTGGALDRAADALAGRLIEMVDGGLRVVTGEGSRPFGYGDIAILCRASRSFAPYENALERAGVPFLTVAGRGFYDRPEIRDLLNALQAIADPTDDLSLTGLLRSPVIALSDMGLYHLCQIRNRIDDTGCLWDVLRLQADTLPPGDQKSAQRAVGLITALHEKVGRSSVADLLKAFLDATDYQAALVQATQSRSARNMAKLLSDAHTSGFVSTGEFLEYMTKLRDSGTREGEARAMAEGAVQIMTVHAAKGLEFPVVVLGEVTASGGAGSGPLIEPGVGILPPVKDRDDRLPAMYYLAKARSDDQEEAESERLLYVAATRAREKLILSGCVSLRKDGTLSKASAWLGKLAEPECLDLAGTSIAYEEEGTEAKTMTLHVGSTLVSCVIYEPGYRSGCTAQPAMGKTELAGAVLPPLLEPVTPECKALDQPPSAQDPGPPQRVWRVVPAVQRPRAPAWVVGSLVHEALATWRFPGAANQNFGIWAAARARGYGIMDPRQLSDAARQTEVLLSRLRAHPLHQEMDRAEHRLHEIPYSIAVEGTIESGIIDALYASGDRWTIVEFKTDHIKNRTELEKMLARDDYLAQAQRYITAVEKLLGQMPRFILCMLNFAGTVHLIDCLARNSSMKITW